MPPQKNSGAATGPRNPPWAPTGVKVPWSLKCWYAILCFLVGTGCLPGGPLVFEVGYHLRKNIHVIFQDQAMYTGTSFRGAKRAKLEKKGMFLVTWQILEKKKEGQIKEKMQAKMRI